MQVSLSPDTKRTSLQRSIEGYLESKHRRERDGKRAN